MAEIRYLHEMPVHILQEFIFVLRSNDKFVGTGKVDNYLITKTEKLATLIYDNGKVSYTMNFTKDEDGNWFVSDKVSVRESLTKRVNTHLIEKEYPELIPPKVEEESTDQ